MRPRTRSTIADVAWLTLAESTGKPPQTRRFTQQTPGLPRGTTRAMAGRLLLLTIATLLVSAAAPAHAAIKIDVLSNRADLVSGGDALVGVGLPDGSDPSALKVAVDGRDVSSAF